MIRVGLIGASDPRHRSFLAALHRRRAGVRIVGLSDPDQAVRDEFGQLYDLPTWADHRDLLAQARPSLVAVAQSGAGQVVIDALRAGCDVLVAPPVCETLEELETIAGLVTSTGRRVTAAHLYRGHPAARTAKEMIAAGRLGRPDLVSLIIGDPISEDRMHVAVAEAMDLFGWLTEVSPATIRVISDPDQADDPEDAQAFGELVVAVAATPADDAGEAVLEVRRRPDLAGSAQLIQVAGDAGAVEWDVRTGLLRSALGGQSPVTVACGPLQNAAEWVLNNLLRKPHPVISTEQSLTTTRMWLIANGSVSRPAGGR